MKEFFPYISLSFFSALQYYGDAIGYEILTVMSSYLSILSMSANIIVLNYVTLISYFYLGMSIPLTHFVGYFLGKDNYNLYFYTVKFFFYLNLVVGIFEFLFTYLLAAYIPRLYTQNLESIELSSSILKYYAFFFILDTLNIMFQGILGGAGKQHITSVWNLLMTMLLMIPLSYFLCFYLEIGLFGLWISISSYVSILCFVNFFYFFFLDFKSASEILKKQIELDETGEENDIYYELKG